jgi:serine/threonine protein kinase
MESNSLKIGRFVIKDEIDSEEFVVCHIEKDVQTDQHCCVKIVPQSEESRNEIEILSKISHPNIVSLVGIKEIDEFYFIFMKLCEETTLLDMLNKYSPL